MSQYFEEGYEAARQGIRSIDIPTTMVTFAEKSAWLSGWWAYHSGATDLMEEDMDRAHIWLKWK